MTPVNNPGSVIYAKSQPQYLPLPCIKNSNGDILITWKLTFRERIKLLWTGILYHKVKTFNSPLQPIVLTVYKPIHLYINSKPVIKVDNNMDEKLA